MIPRRDPALKIRKEIRRICMRMLHSKALQNMSLKKVHVDRVWCIDKIWFWKGLCWLILMQEEHPCQVLLKFAEWLSMIGCLRKKSCYVFPLCYKTLNATIGIQNFNKFCQLFTNSSVHVSGACLCIQLYKYSPWF